MELGIISKSDYLQIKSELANEKLTLANANSTLLMAKVNLMQFLELPVKDDFNVQTPVVDTLVDLQTDYNTSDIFNEALKVKPQIKEAELNIQSEQLNKKIAKADYFPSLSLNAGLSTGWMNTMSGYDYGAQLNNRLVPSVGLNLSIPIYQKNQVHTNVKTAQIAIDQAKLEETDIKNSLRKEIEQAVADVITAQISYQAGMERYEAAKESYAVAAEKYNLGILNTVDLMTIKNDMINAESNLLQTKYNLVYSIKLIDYYQGIPIRLTN